MYFFCNFVVSNPKILLQKLFQSYFMTPAAFRTSSLVALTFLISQVRKNWTNLTQIEKNVI